MSSVMIWMNEFQFNKFLKSMASIGLKRKPKDKSTFPLDFVVYYKNAYILNFEYLSGKLEFYVTGKFKNDKESLFKTAEAMAKQQSILPEIKKKIKGLIK